MATLAFFANRIGGKGEALLTGMFTAPLRDDPPDFAFGDHHPLSNANGAQIASFDEPARCKCGDPETLRCFLDRF